MKTYIYLTTLLSLALTTAALADVSAKNSVTIPKPTGTEISFEEVSTLLKSSPVYFRQERGMYRAEKGTLQFRQRRASGTWTSCTLVQRELKVILQTTKTHIYIYTQTDLTGSHMNRKTGVCAPEKTSSNFNVSLVKRLDPNTIFSGSESLWYLSKDKLQYADDSHYQMENGGQTSGFSNHVVEYAHPLEEPDFHGPRFHKSYYTLLFETHAPYSSEVIAHSNFMEGARESFGDNFDLKTLSEQLKSIEYCEDSKCVRQDMSSLVKQ